MYRDYVILGITLLVIALVFAGIRVRKYNWPYIYFLIGVLISAFLFTDTKLVGNSFLNFLYPMFVPLLYVIGPGIYGSIQPLKERQNPWHIIHYLPFIIGYVMIFLHWFLDVDHYKMAVLDGRLKNWSENTMFYPFSDLFIFLGYPIYTALYYLLCIRKLRQYKASREQYYLPVGLLICTPIIFDVVYNYALGESIFISNPDVQRYLMFGGVFIIFWDVIIVKPPKPKQVTIRETKSRPTGAIYPGAEYVKNESLLLYIEEISCGDEEIPAKYMRSRSSFTEYSPFEDKEWEMFFAKTGTSWNYLKKYLRVNKALFLIEDGFLDEGNVDDLAHSVGYATRASLYLSFRQVLGITLPQYREKRGI
jgi:AraC-like DNA-binding protein